MLCQKIPFSRYVRFAGIFEAILLKVTDFHLRMLRETTINEMIGIQRELNIVLDGNSCQIWKQLLDNSKLIDQSSKELIFIFIMSSFRFLNEFSRTFAYQQQLTEERSKKCDYIHKTFNGGLSLTILNSCFFHFEFRVLLYGFGRVIGNLERHHKGVYKN